MPITGSGCEGEREGAGAGGGRGKKKTSRQAKANSTTSSHLDHNSQLLEAVAQAKPRVVSRLLDAGRADPNFQGGSGMIPPLMLACDIKDETARELIVGMLLDKGATVNLQDASGKTALMKAVINEIPTMTKILKRGADVSLVDGDGNTALNHAAELGHVEYVQQLLREGKRRNLKLVDHQNLHGLTPLLLAAREGHLDTARVLVEAGASLSKRDLEHFMTAQDWMKLSGCFSTEELEFLTPSGKRRSFYRQERMKKGIKTLADFLPVIEDSTGTNSPNVFSLQQPDTNVFQFPTLQTTTSSNPSSLTHPPMKSMFDTTPLKSQAPSSNSSRTQQRRHSISFPSVSSVKTDLYKSTYLSKRKSILMKNSTSEGFYAGALAPLPAASQSPATAPGNKREMKTRNKLPPINKNT